MKLPTWQMTRRLNLGRMLRFRMNNVDWRPWRSGKFLIAAGLRPLQGDVFTPLQNEYLANKVKSRKEDLEKYYPALVQVSAAEIQSALGMLTSLRGPRELWKGSPRDDWDAFAMTVNEDLALWKRADGKEWLSIIHLCAPNHWAAKDKIGKDFPSTHGPVPKMTGINKAAPTLFAQILAQGAMERFAWGLATDDRLNHHPLPPPGTSLADWQGRRFNPVKPEMFVRIERQTLLPVPGHDLIVFTIATTFADVGKLPRDDRVLIASCIRSMDVELLRYKGLGQDRDVVLEWLEGAP